MAMESEDGPFEDVLEELGYDTVDQADGAEHILVYRGNPDRSCTVCGGDIPGDSREMDTGEQYLILRENPVDKSFPIIETAYHVDCYAKSTSSE